MALREDGMRARCDLPDERASLVCGNCSTKSSVMCSVSGVAFVDYAKEGLAPSECVLAHMSICAIYVYRLDSDPRVCRVTVSFPGSCYTRIEWTMAHHHNLWRVFMIWQPGMWQ